MNRRLYAKMARVAYAILLRLKKNNMYCMRLSACDGVSILYKIHRLYPC